MRILQLGKFYWKHPGGLERYLGQMRVKYCKPSYDVDVDYVVFEKGLKSHIIRDKDCTIFIIGTIGTLRSAPIPCPSAVLEEISNRKYDIIEFHHPNPFMHFLYFKVKKGSPSAKLVVFWHSDISRQRILKKIYKPFQNKLLSDANRVIVTSHNYMVGSGDLKCVVHKCEVLPFGLDRAPSELNVGTSKSILSVGRFVYYKGFEHLIMAFAHPAMSDYRLTLIGEGPEYRKMQRIVHQHNLCGRVEIIGWVSDEKLAEYYKKCALFVLPSIDRAEAFGLVLLEAMAYGKPVVTTSIGTGTDFIVKNGYNGRAVKPHSPDELRLAILEIAEDPEKMKKMGAASLERLRTTFSVSNHFNKKYAIYRSLLNS